MPVLLELQKSLPFCQRPFFPEYQLPTGAFFSPKQTRWYAHMLAKLHHPTDPGYPITLLPVFDWRGGYY